MSVTQAGDELRTSWYSDEPALSPLIVGGPTFGKLFSTPVNGQVYAQPLVAGGTLFVVTETDFAYGLDPVTGAVRWSRSFGTPFNASDLNCPDLAPNIGITGTPVIDSTSNIAYFFAKTYQSGASGAALWTAHAVSVADGTEQPGFPVVVQGAAANDPTQVFNPTTQGQRTGLLLLDGVIYAGFGSHCDYGTYGGWIVGVPTSGLATTMWASESGPQRSNGAGIWQSGGGLVSDGPGQILFATGNAENGTGTPAGPIAGPQPPALLGESIVRLKVGSDGTLAASDFFTPYDGQMLDLWDGDLGSAAPVGLPSPYFGTATYPHLMATTGKAGYVYLLNRDDLGGVGNGPGGGDAVLARIGPYGGAWSKMAVWPGDGGYLYIPTASPGSQTAGSSGFLQVYHYGLDGNGVPTLALAGTSPDAFGISSGQPIVTSSGTTSGSALVWLIWAPNVSGAGAQLRAYDAVPVNGAPVLEFSAPVGTSSRYAAPGVSGGLVYVGTRDGNVLAFGSPVASPLAGSGVDFGSVVLNQVATSSVTLTSSAPVTVNGVTSSNPEFAVGTPAPALPAALAAGSTLTIPVTFAPLASGPQATTLEVATSAGLYSVSVQGTGVSSTAVLVAAPTSISLGGVPPGRSVDSSLTVANGGALPLTIASVALPGGPFSVSGAPPASSILQPGDAITLTVGFAPQAVGSYTDAISFVTSSGTYTVPFSGTCTQPGRMTVTQAALSYASVGAGETRTLSFSVSNTGGSTITLLRSKPPSLGQFVPLTSLPEGSPIVPGSTVNVQVQFAPTEIGSLSDRWELNSDDGNGAQTVQFSGIGAQDLTSQGSIVARVAQPTGGGNHDPEVIRDGVYPAVGSADSSTEYDTYDGVPRTDDWIGYQFTSPQTFGSVTFQPGIQFHDGGWFNQLNVQILQSGSWSTVSSVNVSPPYAAHDGVNFETYSLTFPPVTGTGLRIEGPPGGTATFISVGELRVFAPAVGVVASAGPTQTVTAGATVTLAGSASGLIDGGAITYAWTQTSGPAVTLSDPTALQPSFAAPAVASSTTLAFSLVASQGSTSSAPSGVSVVVNPAAGVDLTSTGSIIALVTNPTGGGNHDPEVIRDGVFPPQGSTDSSQEYDTYTGAVRAEDWIGYAFTSAQTFGSVVFQSGIIFHDGGWFTSLNLQVLQNGAWVNIPSITASPAYSGDNGIDYDTYQFMFPAISGTGIRLDGAPGGSATFISVGELRVFGPAGSGVVLANAGSNQTVPSGALVTLDGTGSTGASGSLTYLWSQTAGPTVTLQNATGSAATFTAPIVTASTALSFSLVVIQGTQSSSAVVTVTVSPPPPPPVDAAADSATDAETGAGGADGAGLTDAPDGAESGPASSGTQDITASGTPIALITAPTGGGNHSIGVIDDGVFPAPGSNDSSTQYDTYTGVTRTEDWIGYQFAATQTFDGLVFQAGEVFSDGGWFASLQVQVLQGGSWVDVASVASSPAYAGSNAPNFQTYTLSFAPISGSGIRIDGAPGGSATFISVGELRVLGVPPDAPNFGTDFTASATIVAAITAPTGIGSKSLEVIRDGIFPPAGSTQTTQQYDTYTGQTRVEDWIGYTFPVSHTFDALVFQDGMQFHDGGWFQTLQVQVLQSGTWLTVPGLTISPAYAGNDNTNYQTYTFTFPAISGTGIRIDGAPGGSATFVSVGELRAYGTQ